MALTKRWITDPAHIKEILDRGTVCHLALRDGEFPYVLPMSFGFDDEAGQLTLYFHSGQSGKKLDCIAANPHGAFSIETGSELVPGAAPCSYTVRFESVLGQGRAEVLEGESDRLHAMNCIMAHYGWRGSAGFPPQMLQKTCLLRLTAQTVTARQNL